MNDEPDCEINAEGDWENRTKFFEMLIYMPQASVIKTCLFRGMFVR
jgi:hypothetical protein